MGSNLFTGGPYFSTVCLKNQFQGSKFFSRISSGGPNFSVKLVPGGPFLGGPFFMWQDRKICPLYGIARCPHFRELLSITSTRNANSIWYSHFDVRVFNPETRDFSYSTTLCWLRCRLSYSLLRSSIQAIRGARSSQGHAVRSPTAIDLVTIESHITENN